MDGPNRPVYLLAAMDGGVFCKACQPFQLTIASFTSLKPPERRMHQLGTYAEVSARKNCPLCQLISKAYAEGAVLHGAQREGEWSLDTLRVQGAWQSASVNEQASCLVVWLVHYDEDAKTRLTMRPVTDDWMRPPHFARKVEGPLVNVDVLTRWFRVCETEHDCSKRMGLDFDHYRTPASFRAIDVIERCVMKPQPRCRYLTLSYVWGTGVKFQAKKSNIAELSRPGALNTGEFWDQLSPTIRDTIVLTEKLGERYLWVDSLCIVQDGGEEAMQAIQDMDLIYSQAVLMICAAADRCSKDGLPGIYTTYRQATPIVANMAPDLTLAAQFDFPHYIETCVYNSRGWTYQEEQLAGRSLVFVHDQVYFSCLSHVCAEDIVEKEHAPQSGELLRGPVRARHLINRDGSALPRVYYRAVEAYTLRNLTYPSDILNAFAGILKFQCESLNAVPFHGLPSSMFDMALLWQPVAQATRRPGFPSWSWTGWHGGVRWYGDTMTVQNESSESFYAYITTWLRQHTWITWYKRTAASDADLVWKPIKPLPTSSLEQVFAGYDASASTLVNPYGRSRRRNDLIANLQQHEVRHKIAREIELFRIAGHDGLLQFFTLWVKYRIRASTAYLRYGSLDPVWISNGRLIFLLINRNDAIGGYVMLNESWRDKPDIAYEFILLSDANYYSDWGQPHHAHPVYEILGHGRL